MKKEMKNFDAMLVPLAGTNLIEASAGTGKTYSIAILVLRLLLEKGLSIKEILMVTFTKAAVAELEERIRRFVRMAHSAANGGIIDDKTITTLVRKAISANGADDVKTKLTEAVLFLDEASVLTIHGFCQQTLSEFAFETGQVFGLDFMQESDELLNDEINKFWRKHITQIPVKLLTELQSSGYSRSGMLSLIKSHLDGKGFMQYVPGTDYTLCEEDYQNNLAKLEEIDARVEIAFQAIADFLEAESERLRPAIEKDKNMMKLGLMEAIEVPASFIEKVFEKIETKYISKLLGDDLALFIEYANIKAETDKVIDDMATRMNCLAINEIGSGVSQHKALHNLQTYSDLINNLYAAVLNNGELLVKGLRKKYKAVFIDEFQDTDRKQYEIFKAAFSQDTLVFYIGDPKQSIYAWRSADIFTYFRAKEDVDQLYTMNTNFRSSAGFISAMNTFFMPEENFDTFHFSQDADAIEYWAVEAPNELEDSCLTHNGEKSVPISIAQFPNDTSVATGVAADIFHLLKDSKYQIVQSGVSRPVRPSDIGILVRSRSKGDKIKAQLSKLSIPAVTVNDTKVLNSAESKQILYVLQAMADVSRSTINKALLSPMTGLSDTDILILDDERAVEMFRKYNRDWESAGVYIALKKFMTDFKVKDVLLAEKSGNGERILTNVYQLTELLHKKQTTGNLSEVELISWLKRGIEGAAVEGDEFEQRIESDEEAVKIVTIHRSKGLEYNIVFAPDLNLSASSKHEIVSFRDVESGEYISAYKRHLSIEQSAVLETQNEQENRRLLYVAITRAVYKCFIYDNTHHKTSTITTFLNALPTVDLKDIEYRTPLELEPGQRYNPVTTKVEMTSKRHVDFRLAQQNWRKMSYTMLRNEHEVSVKTRGEAGEDSYDQFVFTQLALGANTGNMLHYILENVQFGDSRYWEKAIQRAVDRYAINRSELYMNEIPRLIDHVLNVFLPCSGNPFRLSDVSSTNTIQEFEFDFPVALFNARDIARLSTAEMEIGIRDFQEIEGMMNGKIDLFFEHAGNYFVLDWKSNYLGNTLAAYESENVQLAMNENNYHLQHLIYTLAAKKYLESRIPNFNYSAQFGGTYYLFLRGIRKESDTGIFHYIPSLTLINQLDEILCGAPMLRED